MFRYFNLSSYHINISKYFIQAVTVVFLYHDHINFKYLLIAGYIPGNILFVIIFLTFQQQEGIDTIFIYHRETKGQRTPYPSQSPLHVEESIFECRKYEFISML
jgi:hypothetical protein